MKKMFVFLLALGLGVFASCDKDDDYSFQPNNNSSVSTKVTKPTIKETARATTTTDLDITFRVTSEEQPKSVVMHYVVYSKKTDKVKKANCTKSFSCHSYESVGKNYYYCRFRHTGFRSGSYIYYYCEATNSAGTTETSVSYQVFKR